MNDIDTKVPIKDGLRKDLLFGIKSRLSIAKILGFSGHSYHVMSMMQNISHSTRAYIFNADGLKAFIS